MCMKVNGNDCAKKKISVVKGDWGIAIIENNLLKWSYENCHCRRNRMQVVKNLSNLVIEYSLSINTSHILFHPRMRMLR